MNAGSSRLLLSETPVGGRYLCPRNQIAQGNCLQTALGSITGAYDLDGVDAAADGPRIPREDTSKTICL